MGRGETAERESPAVLRRGEGCGACLDDVRRPAAAGGAGSHDVLLTKVVQDLKAHLVPACHGEHSYTCGIKLRTKALLWIQTEALSLPDRFLCLGRLFLFHPVTPKRECARKARNDARQSLEKGHEKSRCHSTTAFLPEG